MKKKLVNALVIGMMMTSLVGCGAKTEATDQQIPESSSAVVDESDTDNSVTDDTITSSEVIGGTDEVADFAGAEDDNIVLYGEIEKHGKYEGQKDKEFNAANGIINATENVPIYNGDGIEVGYIKNGGTVFVTEYGLNAWSRFENPIAGTDYDYLYVLKDYVTDGNQVTITIADAEEAVREELSIRTYDDPIFVSNTDGMEMYEFRIPSVYADAQEVEISGPNYYVDRFFAQRDENADDGDYIRFYKTYAIVCSKDTDGYIICQVYYKDAITLEEMEDWNRNN